MSISLASSWYCLNVGEHIWERRSLPTQKKDAEQVPFTLRSTRYFDPDPIAAVSDIIPNHHEFC